MSDRMPPHNLDAERGVLFAALTERGVVDDVREVVTPDDFWRDAHAEIFRAAVALADAGRPVDSVTVNDELQRHGRLAAVGGTEGLASVLAEAPAASDPKYHAEIVRQKAVARRLIALADALRADAYAETATGEELVERAEAGVYALAHPRAAGDTRPIEHFVGEATERYKRRAEGEFSGVGTGLADLDATTDGFGDGQLIILAARPSMGKTALALQFASAAAIDGGVPTLFVSLEMRGVDVAERVLVARSGVDGHRLRCGSLATPQIDRLARTASEVGRTRGFWVDQTPTRTAQAIAANARRFKARHGVGLVIVDYLQLIDASDAPRGSSRQEQVAAISRRLKAMAAELNLPVVVLSQLNRGVESRDDRKPRMSDLRESGAIEQDADVVLLLHRPDYYDPNDQPGVAELIVAKNRNGQTGTVKLTFLKHLAKFESLYPHPEPHIPDEAAY